MVRRAGVPSGRGTFTGSRNGLLWWYLKIVEIVMVGCKRFRILLICAVGTLVFSACAHFDVTARHDPFASPVEPSTFSFVTNAENEDPLTEKEVLYLIAKSLERKGWHHHLDDSGEFLISMRYEVTSAILRTERSVDTVDYASGKVSSRKEPVSQRVYDVGITISVSRATKPDEVVWVAECLSTNDTEDILRTAEKMVPLAMRKFPRKGHWKRGRGAT
jgi:hypothetical protein